MNLSELTVRNLFATKYRWIFNLCAAVLALSA